MIYKSLNTKLRTKLIVAYVDVKHQYLFLSK
jgi:hypothetical protein